MGLMRSTREKVDGKMFISHQSRRFSFWCFVYENTFPYLHLDLACKQMCFPPRKRYRKAKRNYQSNILCTGDFNQSHFCSPTPNILTSCKLWFFNKIFQSSLLVIFPKRMATLRNKRKLEAPNKENNEEHPRNNQARDTNVTRTQENSITHVSEEIESTVTKKLS